MRKRKKTTTGRSKITKQRWRERGRMMKKLSVSSPAYALITTITTTTAIVVFSLFFCGGCCCLSMKSGGGGGGQWELLQSSVGISPMHMQLLPDGNVIMFDRLDYGPSNLSSPDGLSTSHSLLYSPSNNTLRPLLLLSDAWCSSGSLSPLGSLIQTGGFNTGDRTLRTFTPCPPPPPATNSSLCDWVEHPRYLTHRRWYSTNQILHDGRIIIVGGRRVFTYEFFPKSSTPPTSFSLPFLQETRDQSDENNLYPFLHLLPDGTLFIFANRRSISFDYTRNTVVREFPPIPHDKRNYPSSGSSVLLPLHLSNNNTTTTNNSLEAEVMVCGGAPTGAFASSSRGVFVRASTTCGRLKVTDPSPEWVVFEMPMPRVMSDMLLLPTGDVLIINGAMNGTAGWEAADDPARVPLLYSVGGHGFRRMKASGTARMYHSAAVVLEDGRVLVGGSNPHRRYDFRAERFPTEMSLEAYWPEYMEERYDWMRPTIVSVGVLRGGGVSYGEIIPVTFWLPNWRTEEVTVTMMAPPFCTHSFGMNQRLLVVDKLKVATLSPFTYEVAVRAPLDSFVAPPGYYLMFVVNSGIPSTGVWFRIHP